uniref:eCIS core domain-containing protein n=1 Tax=Cupriavidus necator TaxID=106590 RepID=UPI003F492E25
MNTHAEPARPADTSRAGEPARSGHQPRTAAGHTGTSLARTAPLGNLALQDLYARGAIRAKVQVGATADPEEAEADRMADAALAGKPAGCTCAAGQPPCPHCQAAAHGTLRRKPRSHDLLSSSPNLSLGHERRLGDGERSFFEARYHADLSDVRIHDNAEAAASAAQLNARAFALGPRIAFGAGEYRPDTGEGRRLLGHELAHVVQDVGAADSEPVIRRDPPSSSSSPLSLASSADAPQVCSAESQTETPATPQVCMAPAQDPANPTVLNLTGSLDERIASFKELVKTTAIHRLLSNKRNLGMWADLVGDTIPAEDIAALGMTQSGASRPYFELQEMRDPLMRELRARQAFGEFRACTGCHLETQISGSRSEREALSLEPWATPSELRAGIRPPSRLETLASQMGQPDLAAFFPDAAPAASPTAGAQATRPVSGLAAPSLYHPPGGSAEASLHRLFPDPAATREALTRAGPIMQALGPQGYQVLPEGMLDTLQSGTAQEIREQILAAIATRQENYDELIGKIRANEVGYEHFGPVIKSLFPLADEEVRNAIQEEMDRNEFWAKVEMVVVAALSALALLLTIFPPTSAAGIAFFAALEISLGYYGVQKGEEAMRIGSAYRLGIGAHDVFTREQQEAGDAMVLNGFLSVATGYLGMASGALRMNAALGRAAPLAGATTALARSGTSTAARTIQQGEYVITFTEDGAMFVTVGSRPDLVIMVRGETATLYQLLEGGGMRVAATATVPSRAAGTAPLMLTAGSEAGAASTALVPLGPQALAVPAQGSTSAVPLMLGAGSEAGAASTALVPLGPQSLALRPPLSPVSPLGPLALGTGEAGRVLVTPPPREPLMLGPGNATTLSWEEISRMRQPMLWQERETYLQQLYGAPGQQHFPVPNTGGRYVDVPVPRAGGGVLAGEAKSYTPWVGVPGQRGGVPHTVGLSERIQEQINRDVWLRDNVPGYDPRWMFTDAPPSPELRQALRDAGIAFIEYFR